MKSIYKIIAIAFITTALAACSGNKETPEETENIEALETVEITEVRTDGIAPIISGYLAMTKALVAEDSEGATEAGNSILSGLENVDKNTLPQDKMDHYNELAALIKESAEEIIEDTGHIDFQREHLEDLSLDLVELINLVGTTQKLYLIHCPMAFDDTGGDWLSATNEVKNPYFGDAMLTCGAVTQEFEPQTL